MAEVRRVIRMAADPESGWKLWSTGWIEPFGDAPPTDFEGRWNNRAWDLWIYDEVTPSGLVLTDDGARHAFGGYAHWGLPLGPNNWTVYRWMMMDPTGSGRGYVIPIYGGYEKVGTGTPDMTDPVPTFGGDQLRSFRGDYASQKWIAIGYRGGAWSSMGITGATWTVFTSADMYRAMDVPDWTPAYPPFWVATKDGRVFTGNGAEPGYTGAILAGRGDVVRDLSILSDGTGGDPLTIAIMQASGAELRYTVSSPPTVNVVEPSATVTTTTSPDVVWEYDDPEGDAQVQAEVAWFTAAQYGVGGFDPATSTATERQTVTGRNVFGATATFLAPATYRVYVRAQDVAGDWSAWDYIQFIVDLTVPDTPTLTATPTGDWAVALDVTDATGVVVAEFTDDPPEGDQTWAVLRDSGATPVSGEVQFVDHEAPLNARRWYRVASVDGGLASLWAEDSALVEDNRNWLLSVPGEEPRVVEIPKGMEDTVAVPAGVHTPGDSYYHVVVGTTARSEKFTLRLAHFDKAQREGDYALLTSAPVLLLRGPLHRYIAITGDITRTHDLVIEDVYLGELQAPVAVVARP